jgi:lipopolysaccharide export system permease protein
VNTLSRYLLRQVIATLVMTVAVFAFVLLLGNALKELLPLLINRQATIGLLAQAIGLLIPWVGMFALPIGMLTATLLVFGRFSADQELTAARASGLSLLSLVMPILMLSLFLCGVSAVVNLHVAPRCRVAYNRLRFNLTAVVLSKLQLPEGQPITYLPGYIIYLGKNRKQELQDVRLLQFKDDTNVELTVNAPRGRIDVDSVNQKLVLRLYDATIVYVSGGVPIVAKEAPFEIDLSGTRKIAREPAISDMTFKELQAKLRELERRINLPLPLQQTGDETARDRRRAMEKQRSDLTEPLRVQLHWQVAFSFACFSFTLIGIPLGIRMHRRETNIGIAIALGLVAVYYALMIVASSQSNRADLAPHLWMWLPNFIFQAVGAVLLQRANRGF